MLAFLYTQNRVGGKIPSTLKIIEPFFLSAFPGVEFEIAEMACVSSNVRRTFNVPSGVRVQRSISKRDFSHPEFGNNLANISPIHFRHS